MYWSEEPLSPRFAFGEIQFEVRITKVGDQSLPRVLDTHAQKDRQ